MCNQISIWVKVNGGRFADITAEIFREHSRIICEHLRIVRRTRDGNIRKARIDEFGMNIGIHVYQHALCGKSLGVVRGHGVAVIEVWVVTIGECYVTSIAEPRGHRAVSRDPFNCRQIPVSDPETLVRRSKDHSVADCKFPFYFPIYADPAQALRIVCDFFAVLFYDRQLILG